MNKKIEYNRYDPRYNIIIEDSDKYTSTIYPLLLRRICNYDNCMDCHIDVYPDIDSTIGWNNINDFDAKLLNKDFFYDNTRIPINNLKIENFSTPHMSNLLGSFHFPSFNLWCCIILIIIIVLLR